MLPQIAAQSTLSSGNAKRGAHYRTTFQDLPPASTAMTVATFTPTTMRGMNSDDAWVAVADFRQLHLSCLKISLEVVLGCPLPFRIPADRDSYDKRIFAKGAEPKHHRASHRYVIHVSLSQAAFGKLILNSSSNSIILP
jgi:hypothetical protein